RLKRPTSALLHQPILLAPGLLSLLMCITTTRIRTTGPRLPRLFLTSDIWQARVPIHNVGGKLVAARLQPNAKLGPLRITNIPLWPLLEPFGPFRARRVG